MSLAAYQRIRRIAESPRAAEARLLGEVTGEMVRLRDAGREPIAWMPALIRNREVWNAFADACATRGNALPDALRAQIISISLWVDRHTSAIAAGHEDVEPLVEVNRLMIAGLSA